MRIIKGIFSIIGKLIMLVLNLALNLVSMAASLFLSILTMFIVTALKS